MPNSCTMTHEQRVLARKPVLKQALTVLGPVPADQLGVVLPHEHILADFRSEHDPFYPDLSETKVELSMLGRLRRHPNTCLDNLILDDAGLALAELSRFARAASLSPGSGQGHGTVVELSGMARLQPEALPKLAQSTGLNIVAGTGWPLGWQHCEDIAAGGIDPLTELLVRDILEGMPGTGYRAGIIGLSVIAEPGKQWDLLLRACARAARKTGAPLVLSCPPCQLVPTAEPILQEEQLAPGQVWLAGMDSFDVSRDERCRLAEQGYWLLFDGFGKEWYWRGWQSRTPRDFERLIWMRELIDAGYIGRLLMSQGLDRKNLLTRYGGWGYAHILENVVPMMERERRFAPKEITTLTRHNPARALAFAP